MNKIFGLILFVLMSLFLTMMSFVIDVKSYFPITDNSILGNNARPSFSFVFWWVSNFLISAVCGIAFFLVHCYEKTKNGKFLFSLNNITKK